MSKKKRKLASRLKIAELKQACERPDVVEIWDVTAMDPKLLVYLKVRPRWPARGRKLAERAGCTPGLDHHLMHAFCTSFCVRCVGCAPTREQP